MMVLIAGINGLLGSQGIATLCIHGFEFIHLATENHEEKHNDCDTHQCDASESKEKENTPLITTSVECEDHCTDIELKGVDNEAPQRFGVDQLMKPAPAVFDYFHFLSQKVPTSGSFQKVPPARGPPLVNVMTELCIKKTVLRL